MRGIALAALLNAALHAAAGAAEAAPGDPVFGMVVCTPGADASEALCLGKHGVAELYAQDAHGGWHGRGPLPSLAATPFRALALAAGSSPDILTVGLADGQPGLLRRQPQGGWGAVEALPNPGRIPYAALATSIGPDGFRQVILLGRQDAQPYLLMQDPASRAWIPFGALANPGRTPFRSVAIGARSAGQVPAVLLGRDDGQPYLIRQRQSGTWGAVEPLPNPAGTPFAALAIATGTDGYLQVVAIGRDDGQPYLIWLDAVSGSWHSYGALDNPERTRLAAVATGQGSHHQLEAVCLGRDDGRLYLLEHDQHGKWGPLAALAESGASAFTALAIGNGADGTLLVIAWGRADGQPYLVRQDPATGIWSAPAALASAGAGPSSGAPGAGAAQPGRKDDF